MHACAGQTYVVVTGYSADVHPEVQQKHATAAFAGISDVHFIVATRCHDGSPAVLVALGNRSAMAFASRHMYGLTGPSGQERMTWQHMSLRTAR